METKEFKIPKIKFRFCIKTILDFENSIKNYYQKEKNIKPIKDNGYLIDKKSFDDLKDKLSYSEFKEYINDVSIFYSKINEKYGNNEEITYIPLEQKIFNTSKDLIANLSKNNEYIIINKPVWNMFNNRKYK